MRVVRLGLVHWSEPHPGWARALAAVALAAGALLGVLVALGLAPQVQSDLAGRIVLYAQSRADGGAQVFGPALAGWLRAAGPVWVLGMWPGAGVALVALALILHGFALGLALGVAAASGGWAGLGAGVTAILPGNLLALPALWWLSGRALHLAATRGAARIPRAYWAIGIGVLLAVAGSSLAESMLAPALLRAGGLA